MGHILTQDLSYHWHQHFFFSFLYFNRKGEGRGAALKLSAWSCTKRDWFLKFRLKLLWESGHQTPNQDASTVYMQKYSHVGIAPCNVTSVPGNIFPLKDYSASFLPHPPQQSSLFQLPNETTADKHPLTLQLGLWDHQAQITDASPGFSELNLFHNWGYPWHVSAPAKPTIEKQ